MILITLINLLKMFRYNHILLLCLIVSSSIDGAIEIRNSRKLDPTLFQSIIYEEITIQDYNPNTDRGKYYLWIQKDGGEPKKLKESNKYINPRDDGSLTGQYPPIDDRSLKSELTNLEPNTKYIVSIASEDRGYIVSSEEIYTFSKPINYNISNRNIIIKAKNYMFKFF